MPPESLNMINENGHKTSPRKTFKIIVIDFSMIHFVDESGVKCLQKLLEEYKKQGVRIFFANCNGKNLIFNLMNFFILINLINIETVKEFFEKMKCKWNDIIYLTVRDAVILNDF